jgi:hypothetical protein
MPEYIIELIAVGCGDLFILFELPQDPNMKYIVTKQENGTEEIFIFPEAVHHKDMAEAVQYLKEHDRLVYGKWRRIEREPISAGFVRGGKCEGNSESLGLRSRPQDSDLLPWMNKQISHQ